MDRTPQSNVLFVVLDTVRKDRLEPYGYERETTPELSRFAEEATVFESAVAPAPWTLPVHASLFTGRYPSQHGADQGSPYLDDETTLASTLSAAGYDTACYSSNAWITPTPASPTGSATRTRSSRFSPATCSGPLASAWQTVNDNDYLRDLASKLVHLGAMAHSKLASGEGADSSKTPSVIDRTRSFIDDSESDDGWFAFVNLMDAHLPYYPPEEYREEFAPASIPTTSARTPKSSIRGARYRRRRVGGIFAASTTPKLPTWTPNSAACSTGSRETGQWEETTVVVAADHGELHGEHDLYGHEFALYDQLINVPLLVKHPDLEADRRDDLVELLDCYHTVLDLLDVDPDAVGRTDGDGHSDRVVARDATRSLLSSEYRAFEGLRIPTPASAPSSRERGRLRVRRVRPAGHRTASLRGESERGRHPSPGRSPRLLAAARAARSTDAKYVRADRIPDEGYRLDEDPVERTSVDPADDDIVAATERALARFEEGVGGAWDDPTETDDAADALEEADEETRDRLRELGYLE